jgi:hypothetical protein
MRRKKMDDHETGFAPRGQEAAPKRRVRGFGDERASVIRLVAATRETVEAENVAY